MKNMDQIDVSVCMVTYFHEAYVKQAIESVLTQKTKYKYEIVVSDDCSEDGTMDILRQYEKDYPNTFRINRIEVNEGIIKNVFRSRCMCRGKYLIELSGDDYWIRDDVIEKKADFLEKNGEYIGISGRFEIRRDNEENGIAYPAIKECNRKYSFDGLSRGEKVSLRSLMIRNGWRTEEGRKYFEKGLEYGNVEDSVDRFLYLAKGDIWQSDDIAEAYRQVTAGKNYNSTHSEIEILREYVNTNNELHKDYGRVINFRKLYVKQFSPVIIKVIKEKEYKDLYLSIPQKYRKPWYNSVGFHSVIGWIGYKMGRVGYRIKRIRNNVSN